MFKQISNKFSKIKQVSQAPQLSHAATAVERATTPDGKGNTTVRLNIFPQQQKVITTVTLSLRTLFINNPHLSIFFPHFRVSGSIYQNTRNREEILSRLYVQ